MKAGMKRTPQSTTARLQQVVLRDVADDAHLVKIPAPPVCAKRLLERDLDVVDEVLVPNVREDLVGEPGGGGRRRGYGDVFCCAHE